MKFLSPENKLLTFVFAIMLWLGGLFSTVSYFTLRDFLAKTFERESQEQLAELGHDLNALVESKHKVLQDFASSSMFVDYLVHESISAGHMQDYLNEKKFFGQSVDYTVYDFEAQPILGNRDYLSRIPKGAIDKLLAGKRQGYFTLYKEKDKTFAVFAEPILFRGGVEGVLVAKSLSRLPSIFSHFESKKGMYFNVLVSGEAVQRFGSKESFVDPLLIRTDLFEGNINLNLYKDTSMVGDALRDMYVKYIALFVVTLILSLLLFNKFGREYLVKPAREVVKKRRELEDLLGRQNLVLDASKMGMWDLNLRDNSLVWDHRMFQLFGVQEGEFSPSYDSFLTLLHEKDREEMISKVQETIDLQKDLEVEFRIISVNGTIKYIKGVGVIMNRKNPADGNVDPYLLGVNWDITDSKVLEKSLKIKNQSLEIEKRRALIAEKTKTSFLANMSHEIRTPMNGVLGTVQLLSETRLDANQRDMLEMIRSCGDGLLTILNDILDISKIETGNLELEEVNFSINKCIEEALFLSSFKARQKNLLLKFENENKSSSWLVGDVTRIRQILVNLISNAVKFTEKGQVQVKYAVNDLAGDEQRLELYVKDTGIGISPENQEKLFKSFSQADSTINRKFGGTGLGLAICLKLSKAMGGDISIESNEGEGATFCVSLNLKKGVEEKTEVVEKAVVEKEGIVNAQNVPVESSKGKVLVVEDNPVNQKLVRMMLDKLGYASDVAANGFEALDALEAMGKMSDKVKDTGYFLIFMDMQMPEMDGLTATRKIIEKYKSAHPPIVAMTANAFAEDKKECFDAGMDDFVSKPILLSELRRVLDKYSDQNKAAS